MDFCFGMVLLEILKNGGVLVATSHHLFQELFVELRPATNWKLLNGECGRIDTLNGPRHNVGPLFVAALCNLTGKSMKVWIHGVDFFTGNQATKIGNDLAWIVVGDTRGPSTPDSFGAIDKNHWDHRDVKVRFNSRAIIIQVIEESIVIWMKDCASYVLQFSENVTGGCSIFTSLLS